VVLLLYCAFGSFLLFCFFLEWGGWGWDAPRERERERKRDGGVIKPFSDSGIRDLMHVLCMCLCMDERMDGTNYVCAYVRCVYGCAAYHVCVVCMLRVYVRYGEARTDRKATALCSCRQYGIPPWALAPWALAPWAPGDLSRSYAGSARLKLGSVGGHGIWGFWGLGWWLECWGTWTDGRGPD
jgi:hypothetical protein